uniref:Allatostatin neuropeptide n=1 Tax=Supella longipalpa TaxID=83902 RepID=O96501_SUPLO|nr:allatostatin neuropeptide precursor [Supella longipalpa]
MPDSRTCISLQAVLLLALLLQLANSAFGTATAPAGSPEEASSNAGSELLSHLEDSENPELDFVKRLYDFGLGKRAYSYVSEYKRLPVYNFGLGKRSKMYGFGLGKRAGSDSRLYSFGLGKRDYDDYYEEDEDEDQQSSGEDIDDSDAVDLVDKRERLYSFGLGKRARPYSFGLGKRAPSSGVQRLYGFGLGKRGGSLYSFGLGKRGGGRLYAFGLGKRPVNSGRQTGSRFNFGLGKRSEDFDLEEDKRFPQDHRFAFGLGKRKLHPVSIEAVRDEEKDNESESKDVSVQEKKNSTTGERVKRSLSASPYDTSASEEDVDEFARLIRRPFNFGLGKRIPMYDFGIGKRSER